MPSPTHTSFDLATPHTQAYQPRHTAGSFGMRHQAQLNKLQTPYSPVSNPYGPPPRGYIRDPNRAKWSLLLEEFKVDRAARRWELKVSQGYLQLNETDFRLGCVRLHHRVLVRSERIPLHPTADR